MNYVKSLYNTITNSYRPKIDFIKICHMKFDNNLIGLTIILVIEKKINIYLFQLNPISFNLISCLKIYIGDLLTIEPINFIRLLDKEAPVIAIVSNSEQYNENVICFYSVLNQKQLKIMKKKYQITGVSFGTIYFGVGCNHGKIYIHSNENLDLIYKITPGSILKVDPEKNKSNNSGATSVILSKKKEKNNKNEEENEGDECATKNKSLLFEVRNNGYGKQQDEYYNILFDINNNSIVYEITKNKKVKKEEITTSASQQSIFENIIKGASKNISKFAEWSISSFQNVNQLRKSYAISTNENVKKSTSSKLNLSIFDLKSGIKTTNKMFKPDQLLLPYFNEKIGYIKLTGLYLIVGNRENQMFYIFQYFSETNNKYQLNREYSKGSYKLIYSIWKGYHGGPVSSLDLSKDNRYCILTCKKGSNHIYYFPPRDNQMIEIIDFPSYSNQEDKEYAKLYDALNMKIINVEEIDKINHNNYNDTENSLFFSEIIEINQLPLENNVSDEVASNIKELNKNKYTNIINNGRYFIILNDNFVYLYMIFDNNTIIKVKKIQLKLVEEIGSLEKNKENLSRGVYYNFAKSESNNNIEDNFDNETTNLSFFSTTQLNPLFSFHGLQKGFDNTIKDNNNSFYENILKDLEYTDLSSIKKSKEGEDKEQNENFVEKIREAMSKSIFDIAKKD